MDIIVDIDGTIADCRHRRHFVINGQHDWKSFFESMIMDTPIEPICSLVRYLYGCNNIILTTGRPDQYSSHTKEWLQKYNVPFHVIRMRREMDYRADEIVKEEMLIELKDKGFDPKLAIDDRESVVAMWRRNGIICLQNSMRELP